MFRALRSLVLALAVPTAAGCGSSEPTGVKENLDEKAQQQIKDLDDQRQDEWESTKGKKKK